LTTNEAVRSAPATYPEAVAGLFDLRGQVAYVPGGYGGIGEAIAWSLPLAGAKVAVSGRDEAKAQALAASMQAAGHDAFGLSMDAHDVRSIQRSVDAVQEHFGAIDLLLNCVGIQREHLKLLSMLAWVVLKTGILRTSGAWPPGEAASNPISSSRRLQTQPAQLWHLKRLTRDLQINR
jgi:NAD(P)-dependent dehydrogenase (short-subunit alcohol dehydrogenase family)